MPVPKKKRSKMKTKMRRAHHALKRISLASCPECGEPILPHRLCPNCHRYRGKRVEGL